MPAHKTHALFCFAVLERELTGQATRAELLEDRHALLPTPPHDSRDQIDVEDEEGTAAPAAEEEPELYDLYFVERRPRCS